MLTPRAKALIAIGVVLLAWTAVSQWLRAPRPQWTQAATVEAVSATTSQSQLARIERELKQLPKWIDRGNRSYFHPTGTLVECGADAAGDYIRWTTAVDAEQRSGDIVMFLMVRGIGGSDEPTYAENVRRLNEWLAAPESSLVLVGGTLHAEPYIVGNVYTLREQ